MPLVYEEDRPQFYEESHVISSIQQGQILTKVTLPERAQPLRPVQPKEKITYTAEKTLAAEYISKTVHPYIEVEKIEQPKSYDKTVSTLFQQKPLITEQRPERPQVFDEIYSQIRKTPYVYEEGKPQVYDRVITECRQGLILTRASVPAQIQRTRTMVKPKEQEIVFTESIESSVQFISKSVQPIVYEIDEKTIYTVEIFTDNVWIRKDYKLPKRVTFKDLVEAEQAPKVEIFTDSTGYETVIFTRTTPLVLTEINLSGEFTCVEEIEQYDSKLKIRKPKRIVTQFKSSPLICTQKSPDSQVETVTYEEIEERPFAGSLLETQLSRRKTESEEQEIESFKRPTSEIVVRSRKVRPGLFVTTLQLPLVYTIQIVTTTVPRQIITESIGNEVDVKVLQKPEIDLKSDDYSQESSISLEKKVKEKKIKRVKVPIKTSETVVLEQIETDKLYTQASPLGEQVEQEIEYGQTQLTLDHLYTQKMYKAPKRVTFKEVVESEESPKVEIFTDTLGREKIIFTRISPLVFTEFNLPSIEEEEQLSLHSKIYEAQLRRQRMESEEQEIEESRRPIPQIAIKSRKIKPGWFAVELQLPLVRTGQLLVPFHVPREIITEAVGNEVDIKISRKPDISIKSDDYNKLTTISLDKRPELKHSQASLNQESVTEEFVDAFDTMPFQTEKAAPSIENLQSLNIQQVCYNELELEYAKKAVKSRKLKGLNQSRLCGSFELLEDVTLSDDVRRKF